MLLARVHTPIFPYTCVCIYQRVVLHESSQSDGIIIWWCNSNPILLIIQFAPCSKSASGVWYSHSDTRYLSTMDKKHQVNNQQQRKKKRILKCLTTARSKLNCMPNKRKGKRANKHHAKIEANEYAEREIFGQTKKSIKFVYYPPKK